MTCFFACRALLTWYLAPWDFVLHVLLRNRISTIIHFAHSIFLPRNTHTHPHTHTHIRSNNDYLACGCAKCSRLVANRRGDKIERIFVTLRRLQRAHVSCQNDLLPNVLLWWKQFLASSSCTGTNTSLLVQNDWYDAKFELVSENEQSTVVVQIQTFLS